jgi:hypothetical protein
MAYRLACSPMPPNWIGAVHTRRSSFQRARWPIADMRFSPVTYRFCGLQRLKYFSSGI